MANVTQSNGNGKVCYAMLCLLRAGSAEAGHTSTGTGKNTTTTGREAVRANARDKKIGAERRASPDVVKAFRISSCFREGAMG